ncbi:MAG: phospho-N-acetylmuramoyl-pentapeptide-transferase [Deltaproteobacteria bacterium]|nr:phospho-N-acetylmuramoyl-pentapeptide-transferase [Deltaproteobacteria bacterium]
MLYYFLYPLRDEFILFNLFRYITFRTFGSLMTAMIIYFLFGKKWILFLKAKQFGQVIRQDGPKTHLEKQNTPTMGGVLLLFALSVSTFLWCDLSNVFVWVSMLVMLGFGLVGLIDDYRKVIKKDPKGFRGQYKIVIEVFVCLLAGLVLYGMGYLDTSLRVPFLKDFHFDLGVGYLYFTILVVVGAANAVNLTDGLDGLVTVPSIISFFSYGVLAYAAGNAVIANYLQAPLVLGAGELSIICGATIGSLIGFLWYNTHPADIFMGDVGALGLGGLLGTVAMITKNEILLILIGGIFVLETVSVILQVGSFKLFKKRIFKMAPLHHHFELMGWKESKVIVRFWILSFIMSLFALVTLKIR